MALRMIGDKVMGVLAKQYQSALGNQLAQYGEFCRWRAAKYSAVDVGFVRCRIFVYFSCFSSLSCLLVSWQEDRSEK
jgi:ribose/xylose/arabinose/galactoside ABC-type transport system permease subunit